MPAGRTGRAACTVPARPRPWTTPHRCGGAVLARCGLPVARPTSVTLHYSFAEAGSVPQLDPDQTAQRQAGTAAGRMPPGRTLQTVGYDSKSTVATRRQMRPAIQTKDRPREGGFWMVCQELVLKLRHGLQFILGGVVHRVIGIPTLTGAGCGGCRGGSRGTGGGSRGAVWSGSSCRSIRRCGCC
jgi:hypothetical protein